MATVYEIDVHIANEDQFWRKLAQFKHSQRELDSEEILSLLYASCLKWYQVDLHEENVAASQQDLEINMLFITTFFIYIYLMCGATPTEPQMTAGESRHNVNSRPLPKISLYRRNEEDQTNSTS
ncbi:hypothetical protein Fmac_001168 [Flemingia macrophylla]|uniref:Uncharacterized protein n=1 Tax=Flemingia macrophylla TaxID=520843 RepID=A0ABD1NH10_9FABA